MHFRNNFSPRRVIHNLRLVVFSLRARRGEVKRGRIEVEATLDFPVHGWAEGLRQAIVSAFTSGYGGDVVRPNEFLEHRQHRLTAGLVACPFAMRGINRRSGSDAAHAMLRQCGAAWQPACNEDGEPNDPRQPSITNGKCNPPFGDGRGPGKGARAHGGSFGDAGGG